MWPRYACLDSQDEESKFQHCNSGAAREHDLRIMGKSLSLDSKKKAGFTVKAASMGKPR